MLHCAFYVPSESMSLKADKLLLTLSTVPFSATRRDGEKNDQKIKQSGSVVEATQKQHVFTETLGR